MSYGLALIYGVMKLINLANAGVMMLGAFVTFFLWQSFGVDPLVSMLAFGLGSALAGAAGSLLTLVFAFDPVTPFSVLQLKSFTIIVLGGLESIPGVAAASFLLAAAENLTVTLTKPQLENLVS